MNDKPRVDRVLGTYFRKGKCQRCTGSVERTKTFEGLTLADCQTQADVWAQTPLRHKRCE